MGLVHKNRPNARLSSSFASLQSISQRTLADRPQPPAPLLGFRPLQHIQGSEVHHPRRLPNRRCVPPSGFGYPPDGFLPPRPGRPCFVPTALMGFPLRSITTRAALTAFPPQPTHPPFLPSLHTRTEMRAVTPGRGPWVLIRTSNPTARTGVFSADPPWKLPWFRPFRVLIVNALADASACLLPHGSCDSRSKPPAVPEYPSALRLPGRSRAEARTVRKTLMGFRAGIAHRMRAETGPSGYVFTSRRVACHHRPAGDP